MLLFQCNNGSSRSVRVYLRKCQCPLPVWEDISINDFHIICTLAALVFYLSLKSENTTASIVLLIIFKMMMSKKTNKNPQTIKQTRHRIKTFYIKTNQRRFLKVDK